MQPNFNLFNTNVSSGQFCETALLVFTWVYFEGKLSIINSLGKDKIQIIASYKKPGTHFLTELNLIRSVCGFIDD